jgi:hypothetical protein
LQWLWQSVLAMRAALIYLAAAGLQTEWVELAAG